MPVIRSMLRMLLPSQSIEIAIVFFSVERLHASPKKQMDAKNKSSEDGNQQAADNHSGNENASKPKQEIKSANLDSPTKPKSKFDWVFGVLELLALVFWMLSVDVFHKD